MNGTQVCPDMVSGPVGGVAVDSGWKSLMAGTQKSVDAFESNA